MADAKLRLSIITALDKAGLTATKEQVGQLEAQLSKVNSQGANMDKLNQKLVKMPGKVGELAEQLGDVGTKLGAIYVAWKTFTGGLKAGQEIFKQFGDGAGYSLESIKNGFTDIGSKAKNFF